MEEDIHTEFIDDNGIVEGRKYETYYNVCESIEATDSYLRVFSDAGFTNAETRIPFELLEKAGFKRVREVKGEIESELSADELPTITVGVSF